MTAQEEQGQRVVGLRRPVDIGARGNQLLRPGHRGDRVLASPPRALTAELVGQPPGRDRDQPAPRVRRYAVGRPLRRRRKQRLLYGVLTQIELPVPPSQEAQHLRREFPQQTLHTGSVTTCNHPSRIRPARPTVHAESDHRPPRRISLVLRILRHQQLHRRRRLGQHPRDPVDPHPPQMRPVLVVLVDEHRHPRVRRDVPQPLQSVVVFGF